MKKSIKSVFVTALFLVSYTSHAVVIEPIRQLSILKNQKNKIQTLISINNEELSKAHFWEGTQKLMLVPPVSIVGLFAGVVFTKAALTIAYGVQSGVGPGIVMIYGGFATGIGTAVVGTYKSIVAFIRENPDAVKELGEVIAARVYEIVDSVKSDANSNEVKEADLKVLRTLKRDSLSKIQAETKEYYRSSRTTGKIFMSTQRKAIELNLLALETEMFFTNAEILVLNNISN